MRLQHGIDPPAPGRGGKRKRGQDDPNPTNASSKAGSPPPNGAGPGTSNSHAPGAYNTLAAGDIGSYVDNMHMDDADRDYESFTVANGREWPRERERHNRHNSRGRPHEGNGNGNVEDDDGYLSSSSEALPQRLLDSYDAATNTIMGRSPEMVMYLLMKSKHRYALEQNMYLNEELRAAQLELAKERDAKEAVLDQVLRTAFG